MSLKDYLALEHASLVQEQTTSGGYDVDIAIKKSQKGKKHRAIGVDLGTRDLLTLSNGVSIAQHPSLPRLRHNLSRLLHKQQRQKKNSIRWRETQRLIAKTRTVILRCQQDHANKIAHYLTRHYRVICIEGPQADTGEGTAIHQANWNLLRDTIKKKCAERNRTYIEVRPYYTSQICSRCGFVTKIAKEERVYRCGDCGLVIGRDVNAAINLKRAGLQKLSK